MANRQIEAILKISAQLGSMRALKTLQTEMKKVEQQAESFNRAQRAHAAAASASNVARGVATGAIGFAGVRAITDFAEAERRLNRIGITADTSVERMEAARSEIERYAHQFALPFQDAVAGLETLVASGMEFERAMDFLPSILATAQAAGAVTTDVANTAQKAAAALGIEADGIQRAFDLMVTGGKAGQFEMDDLAAHIPMLANSFASLGYEGEEGLKHLIALMQTLREDTATASDAATQAQNVFGKMFSEATANKFGNFGVNLRAEMDERMAAGQDAVSAFVDLTKETIDGDLTKLPLLFTDQEFRLGMQSLVTSGDSIEKFLDVLNSAEVDGAVFRDLSRILQDSKADVDQLRGSLDRLIKSAGGALVDLGLVDFVSRAADDLDFGQALRAGLEKRGMNYGEREAWIFWNRFVNDDAVRAAAWEGGFRTKEDRAAIEAYGRHAETRLHPDARPNEPMSPPETVEPMAYDAAEIAERLGIDPRRRAMEAAYDPEDRSPEARALRAERIAALEERGSDPSYDDFRRAAAASHVDAEQGGGLFDLSGFDWRKFLFGELAEEGKTFRGLMQIDAGIDDAAPATPAVPTDDGGRAELAKAKQAEIDRIEQLAAAEADRFDRIMATFGGVDPSPAADIEEAARRSNEGGGGFDAMLSGMDRFAPAIGDAAERIDQGGTAIREGGEAAGRSIEQAARAINEQGAQGGASFARQIEGLGRRLGEEAAASFRANVGTVTVRTQASDLPRANVDRGSTMANAGGITREPK